MWPFFSHRMCKVRTEGRKCIQGAAPEQELQGDEQSLRVEEVF